MPQTIHVLTSEQLDKSGFSVVRVYRNKARADEDLELVKSDTSLDWKLTEVPLVGGRARNGSKKKTRRHVEQPGSSSPS